MSKGRLTRETILSKAFELASEDGLESLTIGELAKQCGMSKSGLFAHFNSKENLQVALVEYANSVFTQRVISPARALGSDNIERKLKLLLDNWLGWNHSFQGSCMFLDAWKETSLENDLTQQALKNTVGNWLEYLQIQVSKGIENGEFRSEINAEQAVFELYGLYLSAHLYYSVRGQSASNDMFWLGAERLINSWK